MFHDILKCRMMTNLSLSECGVSVVYARLCHYDVIAFVSVLRMCSLVLVSLVYEKWSQ